MDEDKKGVFSKMKGGGGGERMSKNMKIKNSLFKNKKNKPKKTEDEAHEVKRLKGIIDNKQIPEGSAIKKFADLPLSRKTVYGLKESGYVKPTDIQREAIGLALRGLDILGAAQTGSGKTLAFLIPVLEKLYLNLWTKVDGLGALIITPTRELAYQIFETLKKVGKKHEFSVGLIIGGKDLKFERKRMDQLNVIICTPGRLLQHMDENPNFQCSNVQILVLDEADRCLDMGFEKDMNAIIDNLPVERQTLLFSATQTKSVKDLARLSLKSPVYVSVHENSAHSTPSTLQQSYVVCPLEAKLDMLWSFIKHHKNSKILVFLSSCKQVRFVHLLFCRMRPGTSVLALYGSLHQLKRMSVYDEFCKKQNAVMLATDIAARGLDFPSVDWVVQLDCPEDATTYIHRAGRTARYKSGGEALLVLLPSEEEAMISNLHEKKIPLQKIEVNQKRQVSVRRKFEALLARDISLKECGQRAFKSYLKSTFLMKDKAVFDISNLDLDGFAGSLGLAVAPRVRYLQKRSAILTNKNKLENSEDDLNVEARSESDVSVNEDEKDSSKISKMVSKSVALLKNKKVKENSKSVAPKRTTYDFSLPDEESESDGETLFKSKKPADMSLPDGDDTPNLNLNLDDLSTDKMKKKPKSKAALAKKLLKKNIQTNKRMMFDEEGCAVADKRKERQGANARAYEREDVGGIDIQKAKQLLQEEDQFDKQIFRERIRARHREERLKKRMERKGDKESAAPEEKEDFGARLSSRQDDEGHESEGSEESYHPDLDWLPDPDKIYGKEKNDDDVSDESEDFSRKRPIAVVNSDSESEDDEDEEESFSYNSKHKKLITKGKNKKQKLDKNLDKDLMEELALKLIG